MKQLFELAEIKTKDGITHQGLVAFPRRTPKIGVVWIHGLTGSFWHSIARTQAIAQEAVDAGYAFAIFNNRGRDIVDEEYTKTGKKYLIGGNFEKFTDCIKDIDAVIAFMRRRGCKKVVLVGHSTGANKAAYYLAGRPSAAVQGVILLSGLSDVRSLTAQLKKKLRDVSTIAKRNPLAVLPYEKFGIFMNAQRYVSLFNPGGVEDVFPYHGYGGSWRILNNVRIPTAVVIGSADEHLPIPVKKYIDLVETALVKAPWVMSMVIPGANHGFKKKEKELATALISWIQTL